VYGDPLNATDPSGLRCWTGVNKEASKAAGKEVCNGFHQVVDNVVPDPVSEVVSDATPDCLAWQDGCESIISEATDGRLCSSRYDESCEAIKDKHPWTWNASMSLLVAPAEIVVATLLGGPGAGTACGGGWVAYGIEGTWSAMYNDDARTKTGTESWKHGAIEGPTFALWTAVGGKLAELFR
jgi:hypothetical protein